MEAVIDTNVVHHTLRAPRNGVARQPSLLIHCTLCCRPLVYVVDPDRALIDEWRRTAGDEQVKQLVIQLTDRKALRLASELGQVPGSVSSMLRLLNFDDTIDKLILRIALATGDRI